jgi:hypothetical protein
MARAALWRGREREAALLLRAAVATDPDYAAARAELDEVQGAS